MSQQTPALVLGEGLNALAVVRSLGRHNIPVYVFNKESDDIVYKSRHVSRFQPMNIDDTQSVADQLIEFANQIGKKPALFFTSDYYLRFVSRYFNQLCQAFYLQVPDANAIETVTNKAKFAHFTKKYDLPAPASFVPKTLKEVESLVEIIQFPVILKPSKSYDWTSKEFSKKFGTKKVIRVGNKDALVETWQVLQHSSDDLVIQEMIDGGDDQHYSYCIYRRPQQGATLSICVNKIRVNPIHGGAGSFLQVVSNSEMENIAKKTLEALQYVGVGSVCFKINAKTNKPQIHEVNGRFPQWHSIFQACGMDLPYVMYRDMIGDSVSASAKVTKSGKWVALEMDINSFIEYRRHHELNLWQWLTSYYGVKTCAEFAWDDWGPFYFFLKQFGSKVLKKINKLKNKLKD